MSRVPNRPRVSTYVRVYRIVYKYGCADLCAKTEDFSTGRNMDRLRVIVNFSKMCEFDEIRF